MKIKMKLMSDTIFGSGSSVPGGEDIAVLHDKEGFPYMKGSTLKGVFREQLLDYYYWNGISTAEAEKRAQMLLGASGDVCSDSGKLVFSDLKISENVRQIVIKEIGNDPDEILDAFTSIRTFTALDDTGVVKKGSLRTARCINQGIWFDGTIDHVSDGNSEAENTKNKPVDDERLIDEILGLIQWVGSMRNRGFGNVQIIREGE